jgi:nucleoside phosphorylase
MTSTGSVAADVVVLTALGLEYDAVRAHLTDTRQHTDANGTRYEIGRLRSGRPGRVALALIGEGNLAAAAATSRAIGEFTPRAVLFVGVAGGLTDSVAMGDVVVATRIHAYHGGRDEPTGFRPRPRSWPLAHALEQAAREVARTGAMTPQVHFKPIVSGEVVLDSRDSYLARLIAEHYSDAVAVDMESAGLAEAAHRCGFSHTITIRGVSDKTDGDKRRADAAGWQTTAAAHAAAFAVALIQRILQAPTSGPARVPVMEPVAKASPTAQLDTVADTLAMSVRDQWAAEEQIRRVHDPFPLPARWTSAPEALMDHWPVINGARGRAEPVDLSGHGDHIVETFDRVPSRRLVVLGRAGAGKTIITTRFVLTVLADRSSGARRPVPVIFALGSWDPTASTLRDWQIDQLTSTYPILAGRDATGATLAATLLASGRIMAVLDGFDEISAGLRADAIVGINASLRPGEHMLLTSRIEEYAAAVRDADVLTAAAVVRLADLTPQDVADYLPLTTRKPGPGGHANKWTPVLDLLPPALAAALTTPLMISLARAIYSDTDRDPRELLDHTFAAEIEEHLLAGFVPAVYAQVHSPFAAVDARRWLGFLATHLRRLNTYDLAWWQLTAAVPRAVPAIAAAVLIGGFITGILALLAELGDWPATFRTTALAGGGISAAICAAGGAWVVGTGLRVRPTPSRMRLRLRGRLHRVRGDLADGLSSWRTLLWFVSWSTIGGAIGFTGTVVLDTPTNIGVAVAAGFAGGLGAWLVVTVLRALATPVHPVDSVNPEALLRTDRAAALSQGLLVGLCVSAVIWPIVGFAIEPALGIPFGHVFPLGARVLGSVFMIVGVLPIWALSVTVWGPWLIARSWLALTGRLPWPVMTFLRDAHRRGLLRQSGGIYQFRHARLQDQLTRCASETASPLIAETPRLSPRRDR